MHNTKRITFEENIKKYKYAITFDLIRISTCDGIYPDPYLAKTFDDAYEYCKKTFWFDANNVKEDPSYSDSNGKYYFNDYDTAKNTGHVFRTPTTFGSGVVYEVKIVGNFDALDYINRKLNYESNKNDFMMSYLSISKEKYNDILIINDIIKYYYKFNKKTDNVFLITGYLEKTEISYDDIIMMLDNGQFTNLYHECLKTNKLSCPNEFIEKIKRKKNFFECDFVNDTNFYTELSVRFTDQI